MAPTQNPSSEPTRKKRLFLSYAQVDRDSLRVLRDGIEALHHELWIDGKLDGGQTWWREIVQKIQECDAMVVAVSPALLDSDAAALERRYALVLGKPLLPVIVAPVKSDLLPEELASLQFVNIVNNDPISAFRLATALESLPPASPLPQPLPPPPPAPLSYMSSIAGLVRAPELNLAEQLGAVGQLRARLGQPKDRDSAIELLHMLAARPDLYAETSRQIDEVLKEDQSLRRAPSPAPKRKKANPGPRPGPPAPALPEKKGSGRKWAGAVVLILILAVGVLWAVSSSARLSSTALSQYAPTYEPTYAPTYESSYESTDEPTTTAVATDCPCDVLYEVEGTADGTDITVQTETGRIQQTNIGVPLMNRAGNRGLRFTLPTGSEVYIEARNTGTGGTISCRITVSGVVVSTDSGDYIAICEGYVP